MMRTGTPSSGHHGRLIYVSDCAFAQDLSIDEYEQLYEVTFWPHDELDEDDDECPHLRAALDAIGPWAHWAKSLDEVTDQLTGAVSCVIAPTE